MAYTHIIVTNSEIEAYERVAELTHALHGLLIIGRGLGEVKVHTIDFGDDTNLFYELLTRHDSKRVYVKANRDIMSKADIMSEASNVRQLRDAMLKMIEEAK